MTVAIVRFAARLAALAIGVCAVAEVAATAPESPPNIVVILADDLGIGDLGGYNESSRIPTPRLDQLAASGVRFRDVHAPSAVCTPTRYAIMTGTYAWRTRLKSGVLIGDSRSLIDGRTTIAEMLRAHGYATACIGKWHLGLGAIDPADPQRPVDFDAPIDAGPHTEGFDFSYIIPASLDMPPYVWIRNGELVEAPTAHVDESRPRRGGGGGFWRAGPIAPSFRFEDVLPTVSDQAVRWIESRRDDDRPFFLYLALPAPHTPWMPTDDFVGRSGAGPYGDFVAQVDAVTGAVVDALERTRTLENTLLVVTSDNGAHWVPNDIRRYGHRANGPFRGQKADIHEGGHRVPFIVHWPGHAPAGAASDALVGLQDLYATCAELVQAGEPGPGDALDSVSCLGAMRGGDGERQTLVHHAFDGMFAIRHGRWKLIEGLGSGGFTTPGRVADAPPGAGQLYDLQADPAETRNRFDERPDVVADLRARLERIRDQTRADLTRTRPDPRSGRDD